MIENLVRAQVGDAGGAGGTSWACLQPLTSKFPAGSRMLIRRMLACTAKHDWRKHCFRAVTAPCVHIVHAYSPVSRTDRLIFQKALFCAHELALGRGRKKSITFDFLFPPSKHRSRMLPLQQDAVRKLFVIRSVGRPGRSAGNSKAGIESLR